MHQSLVYIACVQMFALYTIFLSTYPVYVISGEAKNK